ncbi:MAG TPA: hypothetical protein VNZ49_06465 [Bacteroidia bacterium]|jgi:hypothetical protein|nr:hypothetical protein [Bacteroidia bacterium]
MRKFFVLLLICTLFSFTALTQEINKHISFTSIYDYLDELANIQVIELNSAVKPYSRKLIGEKLREAELKKEKLTKRQQKDLAFFLKDYNKEVIPNKNFKRRPDLFYYRDSLFACTLNPILGFSYSTNQNGVASHRWNGAEVWGNVANKFGFYFSLRDNGINNVLSTPDYLTQIPGANYKPYQGVNKVRTDFDEARGGISYGWKWGSVSLLKDNFTWGNNYNGANIFSGRQPSFAYLQLKMKPAKWFEFNYIHGSLVSQILDSTRIYGVGSALRKNFIPKYVAASLATFRPCKNFYFSLGNSIVYADKYIQPVYLIPFMFYPSADHTMNGAGSNSLGENSQMFLDVSIRSIPKTHIYTTLFIDEINVGKMFTPSKQTNLFSFKAGIRFTNLLIKNTSLTFEYTRTNPWVYVHPIASTAFSSNNYNMGHYLGQNSEEFYVGLKLKPARGLMIDLGFIQAYKGHTEPFMQTNGVNANVAGTPFLTTADWSNQSAFIKAQYEIINDLFIFAEYWQSNIDGISTNQYTAPFYYGKTNTITLGLNAGF